VLQRFSYLIAMLQLIGQLMSANNISQAGQSDIGNCLYLPPDF
jgi:hypothetical protein